MSGSDALHERYLELIEEMQELRQKGIEQDEDDFNDEDFREFLAELDEGLEGDLLVFAASDFGSPYAFRPEGTRQGILEDVRRELLSQKYSREEDLAGIREKIIDYHPGIHKVLVAEHLGNRLRYHAPAGQESETNFMTVRQYVGMVDWLLNNNWKGYSEDTWREKGIDPEELETDHLKEIYTF